MKKFFFSIVALIALFTSQAGAACYDKAGNEIAPIAIADKDGIIHAKMPNGDAIEVSGFKPGRLLCKNLLFKSSPRLCPSHKARYHEERDPRFCKGVAEGNACQHIVCVR